MSNNSIAVMKCTQKRKLVLVDILGGKCLFCGFNKWPEALEFHHVDPNTKEFALSGTYLSRNLNTQYNELRKCILVCSNCHRGIHAGYINVPLDWQDSFNEDKAQQYLQDSQPKKNYCQICGKEITREATICNSCRGKQQWVTQHPNRAILKQQIRTMNFCAIGRQYGVTDNTIRKWCKTMNLPSKVSIIKSYTDIEWEKI